MISYPVRAIPGDGGTVLITLPDVPEASASGENEEEAISRAQSVIESR